MISGPDIGAELSSGHFRLSVAGAGSMPFDITIREMPCGALILRTSSPEPSNSCSQRSEPRGSGTSPLKGTSSGVSASGDASGDVVGAVVGSAGGVGTAVSPTPEVPPPETVAAASSASPGV